MTLFKQKYRIESARMPGWDYSAEGYYFVTICTKDRVHYLGRVVNGDVLLTPAGEIVAEEWLKTPAIRPNIALDEWTVMPNHLHLMLVITHKIPPPTANDADTSRRNVSNNVETFRRNVSTDNKGRPRLQANSLGSIIGQFKGACTKRIWDGVEIEFGWQTRFWDRVIRDAAEMERAREYIRNNPSKWAADRENPPGLYM